MYNIKGFVYQYKLYIAVFIFLAAFLSVHTVKPSFVYNDEGGFRPFGLGYSHKTVVPMWVVAIILAIFAYLAVNMFLVLG
jgi:hypothetical protein